jgi:hypothetical protein|tara:strand:+ start:386 stop:1882 length:1497 start_codon:yes stop_codon:yes gene_type:complete
MAQSQTGGPQLFPPELSWSASRVDQCNHNSFQITPASGASVASAGTNIRFSFPTTNLMDFSKSVVNFRVVCAGNGARAPVNASYLFSRLQVLAGGQTLCVVNDFGLTEWVKYVGSDAKPCQHKHDFLATTMDGAGGKLLATDPETYAAGTPMRFSMNLGALAHASPAIVPLDMLPSIEFILTVAGADVLSTCLGVAATGSPTGTAPQLSLPGAASTFSIEDATLVASMYTIGNENYRAALGRRLAETGSVELILPKQMTVFSSSWTGSSRFSYSSHCFDKVHTVWRSTAAGYAYNVQKQPAIVAGGVILPFTGATSGAGMDASVYGAGLLSGAGSAEYTSAHQQLQFPSSAAGVNGGPVLGIAAGAGGIVTPATKFNFSGLTAASLNYRINSALVPQFDVSPFQWAAVSAEANEVEKTKYSTFASFLHNYFVMSYRLSLPNSGAKPCMSGMNTLGSGNAFIEVVSGGQVATGNYDSTSICESTSVVQIQMGRQIVVIT